jgi:hypothetical protein
MDVLKEQRVCIKFCQKLGKTATETYEMLQQAFRETAMPRGPECQGIPNGSPPALLTRFGPLRLLPLPQAEEHPEGETI